MWLCLLFQFSACNCNPEGSSNSACDEYGVCSCNAGFINKKCDACDTGYFNPPTCQGKH